MAWLTHWTSELEVRIESERRRLVYLCARLTGDRDAAEDLAQETLYEALRSLHKLHDPSGLAQWLSAIARNVCLRWRRSRGRELAHIADLEDRQSTHAATFEDIPAPDADLEVELERDELARLLDRALSLLPPRTRDVLVAKYVDESPHAEIAERLGLTEGAVAMRLQRGKLALYRILTTELARESAEFGHRETDQNAWSLTSIWCPMCGQQRLLGRVRTGDGSARFALRCPGCLVGPEDTFCEDELPIGLLPKLSEDVRGYRSALTGCLEGVSDYLTRAAAARAAPCLHCGRSTPLRKTSMLGGHGLHVRCGACGSVTNCSASAFALASPEVRRFWREHRRIRERPVREIDIDGGGALVVGFDVVAASGTLDIVFRRERYDVFTVHRS